MAKGRTMRRVAVLVFVVLAACGGGSKPAKSSATHDETLVRDVLYANSQAWRGGPGAAADMMLTHDYPPLVADPAYHANHQDCTAIESQNGPSQDYVMEEGSLRPAPGFAMANGPLQGHPVEGRPYSFTETVSSADGSTQKVTAHATVIGGKAFLFIDCAP